VGIIMNQIANHKSFALPIEQQGFNSHVSLMRSYSLLDIAKYKHKARRARLKAAAYIPPKPIEKPKPFADVGAYRLTDKQQKKRRLLKFLMMGIPTIYAVIILIIM
jgi:hypothetical protein